MSSERLVAAEAWAERVRAARTQIDRSRETDEPQDLYRHWATRFAADPRGASDPTRDVLLSMARRDDTWLDIGAGGGRYSLPVASAVRWVVAVEPSPSMLEVLRAGIADQGIHNIEVVEDRWPTRKPLTADIALMAHVGYDIETFGGTFLDAVEDAVRRCVVIMRTSGASRANELLWPEIHGEPRQTYPMLPEFLELLAARGVSPTVAHVDRGSWGYESREQMLAALRRLLYLRPGSAKDQLLARLIAQRATEHDGGWEIDRTPIQDGVVTWDVPV